MRAALSFRSTTAAGPAPGCAAPRGAARAAGWTLIEMVVVTTVIGLMMAMGLPMMGTMLANGRVRSAVESLQDGLGIAQAEALRRSAPTELIVLDGEPVRANVAAGAQASGGNWMVRVPADATRGLASADFVRGSAAADPSGAPTIENRAGAVGVAFASNGRVLSSAGGVYAPIAAPVVFRVTAANADRPMCVYVTVGGSFKTCDPKLSGGDFRACQPALSATDCPAAG
ncbi:MAG: GspH/FimT family pseudopilin [Burkholderiaceae bacterium]